MEPSLEAVALYASASQIALTVLAKCLLNNGALRPGQFSVALKDTFNEPDADFQRLDYQFLAALAQLIDDVEIRDRR